MHVKCSVQCWQLSIEQLLLLLLLLLHLSLSITLLLGSEMDLPRNQGSSNFRAPHFAWDPSNALYLILYSRFYIIVSKTPPPRPCFLCLLYKLQALQNLDLPLVRVQYKALILGHSTYSSMAIIISKLPTILERNVLIHCCVVFKTPFRLKLPLLPLFLIVGVLWKALQPVIQDQWYPSPFVFSFQLRIHHCHKDNEERKYVLSLIIY